MVVYSIASRLYLALTNRANSVSLIESRGPGFIPPAGCVLTGLEPTAEQLVAAVELECAANPSLRGDLCFAGAGEPLLRLGVLEQTASMLLKRQLASDIRVNTNGLQPSSSSAEVAARLRAAGVSSASVALMTADAAEYQTLMKPEKLRLSPAVNLELGHSEVVSFVRACLAEGLAVECTAVASPGVDLEATRALAEKLGARFRARSWHAATD